MTGRSVALAAALLAAVVGGAALVTWLAGPGGPSDRRAHGVGRSDAGPPPPAVAAAPPADAGLPSTRPGSAAEPEPARILYLHDIDDIKHEIYQREIESVDRLPLLDELIQTGDMDTRELWDSDWAGVDDWKREQNGFTLQRGADGVLIFHPDQATMDLYSFTESVELYEYDEARHEFVSEVDYYGKRIRKVLKFIKQDTLVMMVISGDKVDLEIYDKSDTRE